MVSVQNFISLVIADKEGKKINRKFVNNLLKHANINKDNGFCR